MRRGSKPAFTLIEVLVVVAIIALLVAVQLPSLAKARDQARAQVCASNTHQMGLALNMYGSVYKYTPGHHLENGTSTQYILWPVRLLRMLGGTGRRGSGQHQVYYCPSSKAKTKWDGIKRIWWNISSAGVNDCATFDYGYNDWGVREFTNPHLGLGGHINDPIYGEVKIDRIRRPADMIVIADNDSDDNVRGQPGVWDTAIDPIDDAGREWPGNRHYKSANVVFMDGHARLYLQEKLTAKTLGARRMWNNDNRAHCNDWADKGSFVCTPGPDF